MKRPKLYLDNSFLNRPFDNPVAGLNRLESGILFLIIEAARKGKCALVNSAILEYENSFNPFVERKIFVAEILKLARTYVNVDAALLTRAENITYAAISPIDALHLASAERAHVDFFVTCDYALLKRYRGEITVFTPSGFYSHYHENENDY